MFHSSKSNFCINLTSISIKPSQHKSEHLLTQVNTQMRYNNGGLYLTYFCNKDATSDAWHVPRSMTMTVSPDIFVTPVNITHEPPNSIRTSLLPTVLGAYIASTAFTQQLAVGGVSGLSRLYMTTCVRERGRSHSTPLRFRYSVLMHISHVCGISQSISQLESDTVLHCTVYRVLPQPSTIRFLGCTVHSIVQI